MIDDLVIAKKIAPYTTNAKFLALERLEAVDLLRPQRFDLLAKYIYSKYKNIDDGCSWQNQLYLDHIRTFNGFFENDGSGKSGKAGFMAAYDEVLDSISKRGFDINHALLPISRDGVLLDGAHRAAASLYLKSTVACARFDISGPCYDYKWFRERGLPECWLDRMATELCRLKSNCFIVLVYPRAKGKSSELSSLLEKYGNVWYAKQVQLKGNGPINLIRQVYANENWVGGWDNDFAGARNKANWCFEGDNPLRVFVLESNLDRILNLKNAVRDLYEVGNHSIHINDTHTETLQLAGLLLNENSIHFMNHCRLVERAWFWRLFQRYQKWLEQYGPDDCCIDGSAVMAAYGLRESRDIDFLHRGNIVDTGFREIGSHNHEAHHYQESVANLITDPRLHFYYAGSKFLALPILKAMKNRRGEKKDMEDVALMDTKALERGLTCSYRLKIILRNIISPRYYLRQLRMLAFKIRYYVKHGK